MKNLENKKIYEKIENLENKEASPTKIIKPKNIIKTHSINLRQTLEKKYSKDLLKIKKILTGITKKSFKEPESKFSDLYSLLYNPSLLVQALGKIRPNVGSSTPGINDETLNEMSFGKINRIATRLKNHSFSFSPVRRVYVPKPGKKKLRPLGIPTFTDRIIQEAIRTILEAIYEPTFQQIYNQNYGFRPNKSPHDSITFLKKKGTACNYAIEGDISAAYDNVNIPILIKILRKKIKDEKFLNLIKQGCYSGLLEFGKYQDTLIGVPQGGIASPTLFNIYMHEFDLHINFRLNQIIQKYNFFTKRKPPATTDNKSYINPSYKAINYQIEKRRKIIKKNKINNLAFKYLPNKNQLIIKQTIKEKRTLEHQRIKVDSILKYKRPIRIVYSRYADDFIILTNSNLKIAICIKKNITKFLEKTLKLKISDEKTRITDIRTNYARFLGFVIYMLNTHRISRDTKSKSLIRSGGNNIKIGIDMDRVLDRLMIKGFCNKSYKPIGKRPYSVLPIREIIEKYNYIIRGAANYYVPMTDTYRSFTQIQYILEYSCYGTISTKLKTSIFKIMKKFGKPPIFNIGAEIKTKAGITETSKKPFKVISYIEAKQKALSLKEKSQSISSDIFSPMRKVNWRTYKNLDAFCVICGTHENVEWHHVKAIKKEKVTGFAQVMKQLNRKQIPLCKQHHYEVQQGLYDDIALSDLVEIKFWLS